MKLLRNIFLSVTCVFIIAIIIGLAWIRDRYVVPILTYHHVADHAGDGYLNSVSPAKFAWQMKFINKHNYHVISFDDYVQGMKKGIAFARNTVVIQFDDGYADNYENAFPVLKLYEYPAIVFLISSKIGTEGFLNWEQIKEMEAHDFKVGAHTQYHSYLPDISLDAAKDEIEGSKRVIEAHVNHPIDYFVYPSGGYTDEVEGLVKQAGYKAAGTTNRGRDRFNRNLFELNRIRIKDNESAFTLWAKLSGYYNLFRSSRFSAGKKSTDDMQIITQGR